MGKGILVMSFFSLLILLGFGIFDPSSPVVWLASTSFNFTVLRVILMAVLAALFITNPPRNAYFRAIVGVLCVGLAGWALFATYSNHMKFLDTLAILQVCVTAGMTALERDYQQSDNGMVYSV